MRHSVKDGKGLRDVYVDGVKIYKCYWADDTRGIAKSFLDPVTLDKSVPGYRIKTCAHFGKVKVVPVG